MKLSRKSWHYRLLKAINAPIPDNLCGYFWQVVWVILLIPFLAALFAVLAVPFLCVMGMIVLCETIQDRRALKSSKKTGRPFGEYRPALRRPWLVAEWLRAKKDKVCPLIEWED